MNSIRNLDLKDWFHKVNNFTCQLSNGETVRWIDGRCYGGDGGRGKQYNYWWKMPLAMTNVLLKDFYEKMNSKSVNLKVINKNYFYYDSNKTPIIIDYIIKWMEKTSHYFTLINLTTVLTLIANDARRSTFEKSFKSIANIYITKIWSDARIKSAAFTQGLFNIFAVVKYKIYVHQTQY